MQEVSNAFLVVSNLQLNQRGEVSQLLMTFLSPFVCVALSHSDVIIALTFSLLLTYHVDSLCQEKLRSHPRRLGPLSI